MWVTPRRDPGYPADTRAYIGLFRDRGCGGRADVWFDASAQTPESRFSSTSSRLQNILEGNWQSCQEMATGRYGERVYDHVVNGVGQFEVHLGPGREFAIFPGVQDAHREHHSADNLLKPYRVVLQGTRATQRWEVASLNLAFTVTLGGGSRTDCESWFILLEPLKKTS